MNSDFRKVALIAASLGLLLSLFLVLKPGDDEGAAPAPTATATTTTAPVTTASEEPETVTIRISVPAGTAPTIRRFSVQRGRTVELVVQSELADEVHVHGYDLMADVAPGEPVTISFEATAAGRFEIELEEHRLPIAELEVRP